MTCCWALLALGLSTLMIAEDWPWVPADLRAAAAPAVAGVPALPAGPAADDPPGLVTRAATPTVAERPEAPRPSEAQGETPLPEVKAVPAEGPDASPRDATQDPAPPTSDQADAKAPTGRPSTLQVAAIGVSSVLQPLGLNADGTLEVPASGALYDQAGWFTGSPRPGDDGPAVLLGHVDGAAGVPSVFYRLAELASGHRVTVSREDGTQVDFEVYRVEQHPKDSFPTAAVYGDTPGPELRLITCAGSWDPGTGHYRDNTVVYARIVAGT